MPPRDRTQAALLKAVAADPDNDLLRLVYADWLDEHGQPERAEIIRVQCELERLSNDDSDAAVFFEQIRYDVTSEYSKEIRGVDWSAVDAEVGRRVALTMRERQLLGDHSTAWREDELPKLDGINFGLHRGFWTNVYVQEADHMDDFVKAIPQLKKLLPIEVFYPGYSYSRERLAEALRSGVLDHLRTLSVNEEERLGMPAALADRVATQGIHTVDIAIHSHTQLRSFTKSANWGGLRTLRVIQHGEEVMGDVAGRIGKAKHLANLRRLDLLSDGRVTEYVIAEIAFGRAKQLRHLGIGCWLGDEDAETVAAGKSLTELRSLMLENEIGGAGVAAVLESEQLSKLVVLTLKRHEKGAKLPARVKKASKPALRYLDIPMEPADLKTLAESQLLRSVWLLKLNVKQLNDAGMEAFFGTLRESALVSLDLGMKSFGSAGAMTLAGCPGVANLQTLNLTGTKIGLDGAKALAASKHLGKLRLLSVTKDDVTARGLALLRKRFGDQVGLP